jgi:penicillin-binding protein
MRKGIVGLMALLLLILLTGCQEKATPEERLAQYVKYWNKADFEKMYSDYLNKETKKNVKKEDFVERQEKLYNDLGIKNVKVSYKKASKDKKWDFEKPATIPIQVKMETVAGPVEFEHEMTLLHETIDEKENWYVEWDTSFIFPELAKGDAIRMTTLNPLRGEIRDRNGLPIAINGTGYEIGIVPEKLTDDANKLKLADLLGISIESIDKQLNQGWVKPDLFVPVGRVAKSNTELLEKIAQLAGVTRKDTDMREYPYGEALSHMSGYIGNITGEQLEKWKEDGYTESDIVGRRGLELLLEKRLKGTDGKHIYIDKAVEGIDPVTVAEKPAVNGETITLTIDAELQKTTYDSMRGEAGTSAAVNPKTGETLALVSSPGFDPTEFMLGVSADRNKELSENPLKPLFNRFSKTYAPGSTIKPVSAAIGMEAGTLNPSEGRTIKGETWQKDASWDDYRVTRVHAEAPNPIDLNKALVYSDNIYFAQEALEMGREKFVKGLTNYGFGEEIPFAYGMESSQISNDGTISSEGQLADTAFGQGQMLTNILHLASMYEVFLTDGIMYKPTLFMDEEKGQVWKKDLVSAENATILRTSMRNVVVDGFAQAANLQNIPLAGKTGTAELKAAGEEDGKQNGFFVTYNSENPEFIIAMMIENVEDNDGSAYVAERVSEIYKYGF